MLIGWALASQLYRECTISRTWPCPPHPAHAIINKRRRVTEPLDRCAEFETLAGRNLDAKFGVELGVESGVESACNVVAFRALTRAYHLDFSIHKKYGSIPSGSTSFHVSCKPHGELHVLGERRGYVSSPGRANAREIVWAVIRIIGHDQRPGPQAAFHQVQDIWVEGLRTI